MANTCLLFQIQDFRSEARDAMSNIDSGRQVVSSAEGAGQHEVDVLVIGGGPAGAWAAISASAKGAKVLLVDKGFCGTSGATAPAGTALWHVPPDVQSREKAKASRFALGGELAEHAWMDRVLEQTWINAERLAEWGYPFPVDANGPSIATRCRAPNTCGSCASGSNNPALG